MPSGIPSGSPWPQRHCPYRHDEPKDDGDGDDDDDNDEEAVIVVVVDYDEHEYYEFDVSDCIDDGDDKDDTIMTMTSVSPFLGLLHSSSRKDWTSLESSS